MYLKLFEYLIHSMLMLINLYQYSIKKTTKQRLNTIYIEVVGVVVIVIDPGGGGGGGSRVVIGGGRVDAGGGGCVAIDVGRGRIDSDGRRRRHRW